MKNFKIVLSYLILSFGVQAIANETTDALPSTIISIPNSDLLKTPAEPLIPRNNKTIFYGSASITPGAGISFRERNKFEGSSIDFQFGALVLPHIRRLRVISADYNSFKYYQGTPSSFYFSYGIGGLYLDTQFKPYIPLRTGIEFKHGFVDIGVKAAYIRPYYIFPSPEARAGISF